MFNKKKVMKKKEESLNFYLFNIKNFLKKDNLYTHEMRTIIE
jgi:hypothetical protein